jgi:hypothetical protein
MLHASEVGQGEGEEGRWREGGIDLISLFDYKGMG